MSGVTTVLLLVILATAVATGARHWSIPAPSLLVVAGVLAGLLPFVPRITVPPEVISVAVLPPLLYASAEDISWRELKAVWRPVTVPALGPQALRRRPRAREVFSVRGSRPVRRSSS